MRKFPKSVLKLPFLVLFSLLLLYHSIPFYTNFWPHLYQLRSNFYQLLTTPPLILVKFWPPFDHLVPNSVKTYYATTLLRILLRPHRRKSKFHQFIIPWTHECMNLYHYTFSLSRLLPPQFLSIYMPLTCQLHVGHIQTSWSRHFVSDQVWWLRCFLHP